MESRRSRKDAHENSWYQLATLHGEANGLRHDEILERNRRDWNRWMATALSDGERKELLERARESGRSHFELTPLSKTERTSLIEQFTRRVARRSALPPDPEAPIDFANTHFAHTTNFNGFIFVNRAKFFNSEFRRDVFFDGAIFLKYTLFGGAEFYDDCIFSRSLFVGGVDFSEAIFMKKAIFAEVSIPLHGLFEGSTFFGDAFFAKSKFGNCSFSESHFVTNAEFMDAIFSEDCHFHKTVFNHSNFTRAKFLSSCQFNYGIFSNNAHFIECSFFGSASFQRCAFKHDANFMRSKFESLTDFSRTRFETAVADFRDARLCEATELHDIAWPKALERMDAARQQVYAYERLRAEMERLKKFDDEQLFFSKELRARRALEARSSPRWFFNLAFEIFSGYGRSVGLPVFWLVVVFAIGTDFLALAPVFHGTPLPFDIAAGVSATNLLSPLPYKTSKDVSDQLSAAAKVIGDIQAVFGVVLLFLIGLGLRNRFRMK